MDIKGNKIDSIIYEDTTDAFVFTAQSGVQKNVTVFNDGRMEGKYILGGQFRAASQEYNETATMGVFTRHDSVFGTSSGWYPIGNMLNKMDFILPRPYRFEDNFVISQYLLTSVPITATFTFIWQLELYISTESKFNIPPSIRDAYG